jgi:tetratricopeptide (TPR) repeat protein
MTLSYQARVAFKADINLKSQMPNSTSQPIRIFLAHAQEDKQQVFELYDRLKAKGYKPWLDKKDLLGGQRWREEIPKVIKASDIFLACLSKTSVAKHGYVQREFKMALNVCADRPPGTIYLIPLRFDDCQIPELRQEEYGISLLDYQWLDYFEKDGFDRLVQSIEHHFPERAVAGNASQVHAPSIPGLDPNLATTWYNKGVVQSDLGDKTAALQSYDRALELDPNYAKAWYNKGVVQSVLGNQKAALQSYDQALELNPNDAITWSNKGNAQSDLGDKTAALRSYDRALELDPNLATTWSNKGMVQSDLGDKTAALRSYEQALELDPNLAATWSNKGNAQSVLGDKTAALQSYDRALELDPNDAITWYNKGVAQSDLGNQTAALQSYEQALELDPNNAQVWTNRGNAQSILGNQTAALQSYEQALELAPNFC